MIRKFTDWLSSAGRKKASSNEPNQIFLDVVPDLVFAVGDVHGCYDLYLGIERRIADFVSLQSSPALLIVLGDVLDRGPQSARLMDHFLRPAPKGITRIVLRGNHEDMFLRFLADPVGQRKWLQFGGDQTLQSYGIDMAIFSGLAGQSVRIEQQLDASIPAEHIDFVRQMPSAVHMPGYLFCHAGVDPARPVGEQMAADLMWADPDLLDHIDFPVIVVHGHKASAKGVPEVFRNRINVDAGAYMTGKLAAIRIEMGTAAAFMIAELNPA